MGRDGGAFVLLALEELAAAAALEPDDAAGAEPEEEAGAELPAAEFGSLGADMA